MASAQAMEEELQQSVLLSEDVDSPAGASTPNATGHIANRGSKNTNPTQMGTASNEDYEGDGSDKDASGEEAEEDAEGEDDMDLLNEPPEAEPANDAVDHDDEEMEDEDAEGEDDDEIEGVGAVKIKPTESDEDMDDESEVSEPPSAAEDDSEEEDAAAWEDAQDAAEEDEDSEAAPTNICVFCKEDEENDPSEDFETFLTCKVCGEGAHQQCARDATSLTEDNDVKKWKCPDCYTGESEDEDAESAASDGRPVSQHSDIPKNLLAAKIGSENGDAHSVFGELLLDEDPMDGSRLLRKRKSSPVQPDEVVHFPSSRRRKRNLSAELQDDEGAIPADVGPRSARANRLKMAPPPPVTIEKRSRSSLVVKIQVRPGNLKEILSRKKRDRRRNGAPSRPSRPPPPPTPARASNTPAPASAPMIETPFTAESYSQPFYSFFDRDTDDSKGKPYGGILTEAEADTSKTLPATEDRRRFDQAKKKADDEWRARVLAMQAEAEVPVRKPKKTSDHASQIECIEFGGWEIDTWYAAPYPAEYSRNRVLYICEFCLKYMNSDYVAWRHKLKCAAKHPPGDEIYRQGSISFFEVDGRKNPVYCQNLCLLAKLFLGSKTLYYDVEPFLFYVLCEFDECGYHFVGYFSKEKRSSSQNNVSCILTLPIHQRKGYGNLIIDFSYLLTKVEEKTGSPEKPLSDLGLVSYRSYWRLVLCRYLLDTFENSDSKAEGLSIKKISDDTAMTADDVIASLEGLRALVRDPQTKLYAFRVDLDFCRQYVTGWEAKGYVKLKPAALAWTPYVMGRGNAANYELGPISTVAPREEDEAKLDEGPKGISAETQAMVNGLRKAASFDADDHAVSETEEVADQLKAEATSQNEKVAEEDKENATPGSGEPDDMDVDEKDSWSLPYGNIPASRFEIFPPVATGRRDRARSSVSRPSMARPSGSISRPRPKRPSGSSARRPTGSSRKSSSSRRKSGGTGRGPGRWPKGTKKADYGNADSGPGFPPGWEKGQELPPGWTEADLPKEEVRVQMPTADSVGASVNGNGSEEKDSGAQEDAEDEEDVDAEGEEDI